MTIRALEELDGDFIDFGFRGVERAGNNCAAGFDFLDLQFSSTQAGAVIHDTQSHSATTRRCSGNTGAVVDDLQGRHIIICIERESDRARFAMFGGVIDRLLRDAIKMHR